MSRDRKCSECDYYSRHLDFGHATCLEHRPCITRGGYEPALCDACDFNRGLWDPISHQLTLWRHELAMHSHRMGGADIITFEFIDSNWVLFTLYLFNSIIGFIGIFPSFIVYCDNHLRLP